MILDFLETFLIVLFGAPGPYSLNMYSVERGNSCILTAVFESQL